MVERLRRQPADDEPTDTGPRGVSLSAAIVGAMVVALIFFAVGAGAGYFMGRTAGAAALLDVRVEADQAKKDMAAARAEAEKVKHDARGAVQRARNAVILMGERAEDAEVDARAKPTAKEEPSKPAVKTHTRDEFRALVLGRTRDQVIEAVGKPDKTQDADGDIYWYYQKRTVDPVTGKVDRSVQVVFLSGVVRSVNY
jgi:hypothetical protein